MQSLSESASKFLESNRDNKRAEEIVESLWINRDLFLDPLAHYLRSLFATRYASNFPFEDGFYEVNFFQPHENESTSQTLYRLTCRLPNENHVLGVAGIDCQNANGVDGLVLFPNGTVGASNGNRKRFICFDNPFMIIERDAFLFEADLPYAGHISIKADTQPKEIEAKLSGYQRVAPASGTASSVLCNGQCICVYSGWEENFSVISGQNTLCIFANDKGATADLAGRLRNIALSYWTPNGFVKMDTAS